MMIRDELSTNLKAIETCVLDFFTTLFIEVRGLVKDTQVLDNTYGYYGAQ